MLASSNTDHPEVSTADEKDLAPVGRPRRFDSRTEHDRRLSPAGVDQKRAVSVVERDSAPVRRPIRVFRRRLCQ
jgi:hypothetical protein